VQEPARRPAKIAPESLSNKAGAAHSPAAGQHPTANGAVVADKSSGASQAKATTMVMPDVTSINASDLPKTGRIEVEVEIDDTGRVTAAHLANSGERDMTAAQKAAIAAAENWRFEPATVDGKNVSSKLTIAFDFR
jgi:TonB family protein